MYGKIYILVDEDNDPVKLGNSIHTFYFDKEVAEIAAKEKNLKVKEAHIDYEEN